MKETFYLTYPPRLIREPIIYLLIKKFDVIPNIRGANVSEEMGLLAVELEGETDGEGAHIGIVSRAEGRGSDHRDHQSGQQPHREPDPGDGR